MFPETERKANELIRLLGALGQAQELSDDPAEISDLTSKATEAHLELKREVA